MAALGDGALSGPEATVTWPVTPCALKLLGRGRWTCATHGTAGGPDECLGLCPAAVAQQQEVARECDKPGHTHDTPGADGVPTTRPFLKTDCPACVDAALDPFKLALAEARREGDRLREIVMGAHAVRCTCGERISGYYPFIADPRCIAIQAGAATSAHEGGGTRQVPRGIRFYGDDAAP